MSDRVGWFADVEDVDSEDGEPRSDPAYPWQPVLQTAGLCLSLDIWFASRAECEQWLRDNVIGVEMIEERP
ncbi:hypothetical protein ACQEVC_45570 [Plantactinospora sp. CA-294935]|uniref:hypothetical protein n=1 Tax=Plantactinospora sp. CA-294935 TaxID=3240012 RepID=UPI003D8B829A